MPLDHRRPPLYAVDTPIGRLHTPELLLVATLRLFPFPWRDPVDGGADWSAGLRAARIDECAIPAFDALFGIVAVAALHPLDLRSPRCRVLGADEARLLQLVSAFQHGRDETGAAILADWLPAVAAQMALLPAQGLASALARGGLILPRRHADAVIERGIDLAHANPGLLLIQ